MTNLIKQKTKTFAINRTVNYMLTALIFITVLFYAYFANTTVRTLTVLEKIKRQMQSLSMEVSERESERLLVEENINTKTALQLGLVEINHSTFVTKTSQKTAFSLEID